MGSAPFSAGAEIEFAAASFKTAEGEQSRLVAYVLPKERARTPSSPELQKYLQSDLPDYMIPSVFIELTSLPLSPSVQVDTKLMEQPGNTRHIEKPLNPNS